ncbi:MAG TPA: SDR family NAD(P)-dependent oxidoreductase [Novosphingobium sp.]|nr:SDR family NAD(P)-dependent oxidoreductase [Novosphingobium sp.]
MNQQVSFAGRAVIVTGAGGGIGREYALEIARRGGRVLVNDLGGDVGGRGGASTMAEQVVDEIRMAGGEAVPNGDSVATTEGCNAMVEQALAAFGRIDALICNAGIMRNALIEDITDEDWDATIGVHLSGSFRLTRAVWPHMKRAGYGRIVYTASSAGLFGTDMVGAYASAKAGILGLMNVAAIEGAGHGILANAIMPNAVTRMAMQAAQDWAGRGESHASAGLPPEIGNSMNPEFNMPLGVYLASETCADSHALWSQCLGRVARIFVGVVPGWHAQRQSAPTVEQIAEHWAEIADTASGFAMPGSPTEELGLVLRQGANREVRERGPTGGLSKACRSG